MDLRISNLTKDFDGFKAVNNFSYSLDCGVYGLLGVNGAGKTTLLRIISDLSTPTSGEYRLFGKSGKEMKKICSRMGTLIETPGYYENMTAVENLRIKCIAMGEKDKNNIENILESAKLLDALYQSAEKKGEIRF